MRLLTIKEVQAKQLELMKELHSYLENKNIKYYLIAGSALGAVRHDGFIPWDDDIDIGMFRDDYEKFLDVCKDFGSEYDIVNFNNSQNCDFCLTRIYFKNTLIDDKSISETKLDKRLYFDIFPLDNVSEDINERNNYEKKIKKIKNLISRIDVRNYNNSKSELLVKKATSLILSPFRNKILKNFDKTIRLYQKTQTQYICSLCSQYSFKKQVMPKSYYGKPTLHVFEDTEFYIPQQIDKYLTTLYGDDYMQVPPEDKRRKGHDIYSI